MMTTWYNSGVSIVRSRGMIRGGRGSLGRRRQRGHGQCCMYKYKTGGGQKSGGRTHRAIRSVKAGGYRHLLANR
jgi:hypothetical protein